MLLIFSENIIGKRAVPEIFDVYSRFFKKFPFGACFNGFVEF